MPPQPGPMRGSPSGSVGSGNQPPHLSNPPPQPFPVPGTGPHGMTRMASKDEEDTMKNLRKTFAGIFGDM